MGDRVLGLEVGLVLGCTLPSLCSAEGWWRRRKPDLPIDLSIVSLVLLWTTRRGGATLSGACRPVVATPPFLGPGS